MSPVMGFVRKRTATVALASIPEGPLRFLEVIALVLALAPPATASEFAGGPVPVPPAGASCLPAELSSALRAQSPPAARTQAALATLYADPMPGGIDSFGRTVVNYVDLDPTTALLDWNCGSVTYDGHAGIDIEIRDFYDMDAGVPILCAASGTVVSTHDGEFDRQTAWLPGVTANDVIVQHADGSYAYYWHMRRGSVRVALGQPVATGDTLGLVGSSGFSSGPHLHFETYDAGTREPFSGPCNPAASRWISQPPYVWTNPFQLFNHGATTLPLGWPLICERPPSKTHVVAGSTVYSWIRSRNLSSSDLVTYQFWSPLGLAGTYSFHPSGSYSSSWWYVSGTMPTASAYFGAWHVDILRNGALIASEPYTLDATPNQLPTIASRSLWVRSNGRLDVDLAGQDADGTVFWHNLQTGPAHGTAALGDTRRHLLHYVPTPGYLGPDSVTVYATDDENANGASAVIRFEVTDQLAVDGHSAPALEFSPPSPNPARTGTRLAFRLPAAGVATLELLDVGGRRVAKWSDAALAAGPHELAWGSLTGARAVVPGLYFVRLTAAGASLTRRLSVID